jgi:hypothetical protein
MAVLDRVLPASFSKRAQLKIQQMAFVLVAMMILFGLAGLIFLAITLTNLQGKARVFEENAQKETVQKLAGSPEFMFTAEGDCSTCIDLDKLIQLKDFGSSYKEFWNVDYLRVERIYPEPDSDSECEESNYFPEDLVPHCKTVTLVKEPNYGSTGQAIVTLVRYVPDNPVGYFKYEIGRITFSEENKR